MLECLEMVYWERRRPRRQWMTDADYVKLLSRHREDVGAPIRLI